jgi:hypothetical protein
MELNMDEDLRVWFTTNIDAYSWRTYPDRLPFRPQVGDAVPFVGQEAYGKLPFLEVTKVTLQCDSNGRFERFVCDLWFSKNTHPEICHKILNHEIH